MKRTASIYAETARTYFKWAPALLIVAVIVFVPVGLADALTAHTELGSSDLSDGVHLATFIGLILFVSLTGLVGEVFYSGVVAILLTESREQGSVPSLLKVARRLDYGRLIAVDILYGLMVAVGVILLVAPGILLFTWLGLAGPIVEIEGRGVRAAFTRSWRLVRGHFWMVLSVLAPIEIIGDALTGLFERLSHHALGDTVVATWLAESVANIALTPVFAVAAVLLTLKLIAEHDHDERIGAAAEAVTT